MGIVEFWSFLRRKHDLRDLWLQQYGAEAYTSRISLAVLQRIFPGQLGFPRGDMDWPARSHDLSMCDFSCEVILSIRLSKIALTPLKI